MSQSVYLKRGTSEKVKVMTTYRTNIGHIVFYENDKGLSSKMGAAKFKKTYTWLSGDRIKI